MVDINLTYFIEILIFLLTYVVSRKLIFGPFLEEALEREERVEVELREAREAERELEMIKEDMEMVLHEFVESVEKKSGHVLGEEAEGAEKVGNIARGIERAKFDESAVEKSIVEFVTEKYESD